MKSKRSVMRGYLGVCLFAASMMPAFADSLSVNFEDPTYTVGDINGQDGWSKTGSYDAAVVANTYGYPTFGSQSLRISNAVTSGSFGDQTFAKPLNDAVGEVDATDGGFPTGNLQTYFDMRFDIASTVPGAQQPGLAISVSPDRGDGSRMSYLSFTDAAGGIDVTFYDVQGTSNPANFVGTQIASGLDRSVPHRIRLTMDTIDGESNDVVRVYIDGTLAHTGTSWENYYRYDPEASAEQSPRIVKTVIFRAAGTAAAATSGAGFLIDNVSLASSNRLTNGSFEDGPGGSYAYLPGGASDLTGWSTTQNGVEWFDPNFYSWGSAEDGSYGVDLAPYIYTGGGVKQTVPTQPNQYYQVRFYASTLESRGRDGTGRVELLVNGGLQSVFDLVNHTPTVDWGLHAAYFKSTSAATTIEFQNNQDPNAHFALIDGVSVAAAPAPVADLTVSSVTVSPSPAAVGQLVDVTATVTNSGATTVNNFQVDVYKNLSGPPSVGQPGDFTCSVSTLAPGDSTDCSGQVTYDGDGVDVVWAQADSLNSVPETNENNNTGHAGLAVRFPDLRVISLSTDSTSVLVGDPVTITATVENVSAVDAVGSFSIDLYQDLAAAPAVGQAGDYSCVVNGLGPLDTAVCSTTVNYAASGVYEVWAQADTQDTLVEADEGNNVKGPATINVIDTYTLTLGTAGNGTGTVSGDGVYNAGQTAHISATAGAGSTFSGWSGADAAECSTGAVAMDADKNCTANFTLNTYTLALSTAGTGTGTVGGAGTYDYGLSAAVTASADAGSVFAGWSGPDAAACGTGSVLMDADKSCTATFNLAAAPADLVVSSLTATPSPAAVGQTVTITAIVENTGGTTATNFQVDLYKSLSSVPSLGQVGDITCTVVSLTAGDSTSCSGQVSYGTVGNAIVWAQADTLNDVTEGSETNNKNHTSVAVREPDLRAIRVTASSGIVANGDPVTLEVLVKNASPVDAIGSFQVDIYRNLASAPSAGQPGDFSCTVNGLAAYATTTCSASTTYPGIGTYRVWGQVDTLNGIDESNEGNNVKGYYTVRVR